jgi:hypothetical protein
MINKRFFIIILMTFLTIASWVAFDIVHARTAVTTPPSVESLLEPINTNFDQDVINEL